jgi:hypothetical protein
MSYLRFLPEEYQAIIRLCRPLNLKRYRPHTLQRFLVWALGSRMPGLTQRIANYRRRELRILHDHLWQQRRPEERHSLSEEEFGLVGEAFGPLLFNLRFLRPVKRALVQHFRDSHPALATKLELLSFRHFEVLCEQVQERTRRGA